ncbi:WW domain-binding protein 11 [Lucilia cuprina]|uniref:WW domain-binding protein 11 n=1 Tax=Lucilia cuprina TaxID=7375 RepID=UPI001F06F0C0|nr:WW domain-binding protein 11 [Lucilia cuprina]
MGRRSINTTKSGKYMNPTDQARKEARKKELKKNKKQRQMVRAAVLKNKDPSQILEEMEKIDEMEYNVLQPSPLNEKVLRDKRKKLKETFDRVMRLYHNDDPEHWSELKRKEVEYEKKRLKKQQYYESVKHAQSVQIDEIPLPSSTQTPATTTASSASSFPPKRLPPPPTALSLPPFAPGAPPGALKKTNDNYSKLSEKTDDSKKKEILGVPVGPPPDLIDFPDLDTDAEDDEVVLKKYVPKSKQSKVVPKPNSLQQRMLAISGQNIDDFMKEMENVHKKKVAAGRLGDNAANTAEDSENKAKTSDAEDDDNDEEDKTDDSNSSDNTDDEHDSDTSRRKRKDSATNKIAAMPMQPAPLTAAPMPMPMNLPSMPAQPHMHVGGPPVPPMGGLAPPPMMFRPPPRPPGMHAFGIRMPPGPPPGPRPGMPRMGIRIPGPPPGMPPRMAHHKNQQLQNKDSKGVTTITAKPQIRNLSADVTRFVPSTLRVKRDDARKPNRSKPYAQETPTHTKESNHAASKDDAYTQFMNEMQGLL